MSSDAIAYLSFDTVPAAKGAAVHIEAFVKVLATLAPVQLVTVSPTADVLVNPTNWPNVEHVAFPAIGPTLIHRVRQFRAQVRQWLQGRRFAAIHLRSIYEGFPIALEKDRWCDRLVFEVNGLPSIELKYRYPDVENDRELLHKLLAQEQVCLDAADLVVTPSAVTQAHLLSRRVPPEKIRVIPNGVDLHIFHYRAPLDWTVVPVRLLYFGTLSAWQGVDLAIRAVALVNQDFPVELVAIAAASKRQAIAAQHLAAKLGIARCVHLREPVSQPELVNQLHQSHATLAPLSLNDRNLVQGCCPLKVLEGMAAGTPVITSNLPVVQELGQPNQHFLAVKPNSVQAIADAIDRLRHTPDLATCLSQAARQQVETHFTWQQAGAALLQAYRAIGIGS
jgi:glycosyltransferase involved in cell wall biosynthesis